MADAIISASGMRLLKLLVGNPPQSISEMMDALEVTRTAVTEQLNELVRAGFVEREPEHLSARGRPQYLYKATNTASLILHAQKHCQVVPSIWRVLEDIGGGELVSEVRTKVAKILAEQFLPKITAKRPQERFRQLSKLLNAEGDLTEVSTSGGRMKLHKRSCAFLRLVDEEQTICCLDQEMMSFIVGKTVRRIDSRHAGACRCTFEIADEKSSQKKS
jgi:predicted ArsR family transcriptional regulator